METCCTRLITCCLDSGGGQCGYGCGYGYGCRSSSTREGWHHHYRSITIRHERRAPQGVGSILSVADDDGRVVLASDVDS